MIAQPIPAVTVRTTVVVVQRRQGCPETFSEGIGVLGEAVCPLLFLLDPLLFRHTLLLH